ncbi:DUF692 domain-containing protein [Massilia sp. DJPM01]|uniref:DUF692 domain-containing protein n=1 Tax=Massilia sp. DJPM01 TaxID=3024404 RepID=UPI00259F3F29|nr:DUF692 domain-containing protein [Massilia sp. DJPM01]MDM5179229.1 DUF692 domain-containing protein [Massilia sp. DJPM01]
MLPVSAGISFRPEHFHELMDAQRPGLWLELHPENYLAPGGARPRMLDALASRYPLSLHGVSLSLAGPERPDPQHLAMLAALVARVRPQQVSEHLAWSRLGQRYEPDLLPVVRGHAALLRTAAHISEVQDALGCQIAVENPSHYMTLAGHDWDEPTFLTELSVRTGCQLLIDVSNLALSAHNIGTDARHWLDQIPAACVAQFHLAGFADDPLLGAALRIDSHAGPVNADSWLLYRDALARIGPRPTLIEWDQRPPSLARLLAEREQAQRWLTASTTT